MPLLVTNARILDPSQNLDVQGSLLVVDGKVAAVGPDAAAHPGAADAEIGRAHV